MMQLRKDNFEGFIDIVSEMLDEVDDFYMYLYGGDSKMQICKWMVDKDLNDVRLNEIL